MTDILKGVEVSDKVFEEVRKFLEFRRNRGNKNRNAEITQLRKEYDKKQADIDNLMATLTAAQSKNSILAVNAIIDNVEKKQKEKEEINYKLQNCSQEDNKVNLSLAAIFKLAKEANKLFESSHLEQKRQILNLVSSNFSMKGKQIDFLYKKPFDKMPKGFLQE